MQLLFVGGSVGEESFASIWNSDVSGPYQVVNAPYGYDPRVDELVLRDGFSTKVQLAGHLWQPVKIRGALPVILMLHGNHQTCGIPQGGWRADVSCEFTFEGACDASKVEVPSHLGFSYLAEKMASWGFIVVSINVNRGINCNFGGASDDEHLILARGKMILRTLQLLSEWNRGRKATPSQFGVSLRGKIDFSHVGLMGHSRGGEGARAAVALYREQSSPWPRLIPDAVKFKALFEIAPVDGQADRVLDPTDLAWAVLLGSCDGDLWRYPGARVFNRLADAPWSEVQPSLKSVFYMVGANHNFFNTEWKTSDSMNCLEIDPVFSAEPKTIPTDEWTQQTFYVGSSQKQQQLAQSVFLNLMRSHLGTRADPSLSTLFDTAYRLPRSISSMAQIERAFLPALGGQENPILANLNYSSGPGLPVGSHEGMRASLELGTETFLMEEWLDQQIEHGIIHWSSDSEPSYLQINFDNLVGGVDISPFGILDFRLSRQFGAVESPMVEADIALVDVHGQPSAPLSLSRLVQLREPVGYVFPFPFLQTLSVPLRSFGASENFLRQVRGLRFTFGPRSAGALNVDEIRLRIASQHSMPTGAEEFEVGDGFLSKSSTLLELQRSEAVVTKQSSVQGSRFEIELKTKAGSFPVGGAALELNGIRSRGKLGLRWKDPRKLDTLVIQGLDRDDLDALGRARRSGSLKIISGPQEWIVK